MDLRSMIDRLDHNVIIAKINSMNLEDQQKILSIGDPRLIDVISDFLKEDRYLITGIRRKLYDFVKFLHQFDEIMDVEADVLLNILQQNSMIKLQSVHREQLLDHLQRWKRLLIELGTQSCNPLILRNGKLHPNFEKVLSSMQVQGHRSLKVYGAYPKESFKSDIALKYPEAIPYLHMIQYYAHVRCIDD
jgi:hypothetical protein